MTPAQGAVAMAFTGAADPDVRLGALGLVLPFVSKPAGSYVPAILDGQLLFLSGQGPVGPDGVLHTGKVGADVTLEQAYGHAWLTGLNLLAVIRSTLGSLARVRKVVKLFGMVNATGDFARHPQVINGCSDLLLAVFGPDAGPHARSAIGVGSLPGQITVEIELVVAVRD